MKTFAVTMERVVTYQTVVYVENTDENDAMDEAVWEENDEVQEIDEDVHVIDIEEVN